jgi:predicted Zn-dependent protease
MLREPLVLAVLQSAPAAGPSIDAGQEPPPPGGTSVVRLSPAGGARDARLRETLAGTGGVLLDDFAAQARSGWEAYEAGDTKGALAALTACATHPAAPPWVHYVLDWARFAEGDIDGARTAWTRVREAVPEVQSVCFDLADCDLRQNKARDALTVLRNAASRWPASVEVLNAVGVVQTSLEQFDDATATFERAVLLEPGATDALFSLARAIELQYVRGLREAPQDQNLRRPESDIGRAAAEY